MQSPEIDWSRDGVPRARAFDDPYFSAADGLAETEHVFLGGNALPARFAPGFAVGELGFGTGLTCVALWRAWDRAGMPGPLAITSTEAFPLSAADMARALGRWPELAPYAAPLLAAYAPGAGPFDLGSLHLTILWGDARATLPRWTGSVDAWCLDGFSPARNPAMWDAGLLHALVPRTRPGGTFATYCAAGHVRRTLEAAGFAVERRAGFGTKRHMSAGRLR